MKTRKLREERVAAIVLIIIGILIISTIPITIKGASENTGGLFAIAYAFMGVGCFAISSFLIHINEK